VLGLRDREFHRVFVPVMPEASIGHAGQRSEIELLVITRHLGTTPGIGPGSAPTWAAGHSMPSGVPAGTVLIMFVAGLVPYSPLGRGLLTATLTSADIASSDFRHSDPRFSGGAPDRNLAQVAPLRGVADGLGITPGQLALAWLLAQGDDVVPIPGGRHPARIAENAAAAGIRLSPADLARLEAVVPRAAWAGDRRSFAAPATTRSAGTN
jgi:hypothetical protein